MSQNFSDIQDTDFIDTSIVKLQDRDNAVLTCFSGKTAPDNPFEDLVWNDLTEHKIKRYVNNAWEVIIDYSFINIRKSYVDDNFQKLNSGLTDYSLVDTQDDSCGFANTTWIPISYFALNNLLQSSPSAFEKSIGIKELAHANKLNSTNIEDHSISKSMINSSVTLLDSPYNVGDIIPSFNSSDKRGCVKLSKSKNTVYTVGGSSSNSTYNGNIYKNLYKFVWESLDLPIYSSGGIATSKGETWLFDWNNNKKLELPHINLPNSNIPEDIVITRNTGLGLITIPKSAYYEIKLVGAGGGGCSIRRASFGAYYGYSVSGGSGGGFIGNILLEEGETLTYSIGKGGTGRKAAFPDNGEQSNIISSTGILSICTGGKGYDGNSANPSGGTVLYVDTTKFVNYTEITGSAGNTISGFEQNINIGPFDNDWGAGGSSCAGDGQQYYANDGFDGALSIHYIAPKEYGTTDPNLIAKYDLLNESLIYFMKY